ncbi:MAG: hypothetical protein ACLFQV_05165 [Vulcanimicrobiota bacterium]
MPFDNLDVYKDFKIALISVETRFGLYKRRIRQYNIKNLSKALYQKDNVYLVAEYSRIGGYEIFVKENYNADIIPVTVFDKEFTVIKMVQRKFPEQKD